MCRSVEIATLFAVPLRRTDGHSKKRRYEAAYGVRRRRPLAGLQEVEERQIQTARDLVLLVFALLRLPDARSAWRRMRCRCPAGAVAPAGCLSWALLRFFASSLLRFFAVNRGYVSA